MSGDELGVVKGIIIGVITGAFSAGTIWGILKTELRWHRQDINRILKHLDMD